MVTEEVEVKANIEVEALDSLVNGLIESALTEALGKNSDAIVGGIVRAVLNEQVAAGYSRKDTMLRQAIREGVRERVHLILKDWFANNADAINSLTLAIIQEEYSPTFIADCVRESLNGLTSKLELKKKKVSVPENDDDDSD
jgi:hypothetical protein